MTFSCEMVDMGMVDMYMVEMDMVGAQQNTIPYEFDLKYIVISRTCLEPPWSC